MAGKVLQADSSDLAHLAGQVLSASGALGKALAGARGSLSVPTAAFGNSAAGPAAHGSHAAVVEQGGATTERLVEVLEGDVDRIYQVAFAYQRVEQENADLFCRHHRMGGPTPC